MSDSPPDSLPLDERRVEAAAEALREGSTGEPDFIWFMDGTGALDAARVVLAAADALGPSSQDAAPAEAWPWGRGTCDLRPNELHGERGDCENWTPAPPADAAPGLDMDLSNHHNAARCPYCKEPLTKAETEVARLRDALSRITTSSKPSEYAARIARAALGAPRSGTEGAEGCAAPAPADPLEGHVEVDWDRPLDEWETAFKDELFLWGPFFRGLGHGHAYLDANARYALARIAGILHRSAPPADAAPGLRDLELEIIKQARRFAHVWDGPGAEGCDFDAASVGLEYAVAQYEAALGSAPPRSGEAGA